MFCKCSNTHNYQVIGLCNSSVFSTNYFNANAWTEISVPEMITLPECKPPVENIDKVYISAKVVSTKIIDTPPLLPASAPLANVEQLHITGKKLIVDLELCQTIIYTADVPEQSVHAIHTTMPYCAYIVLPADTVSTDEFCVRTCIEDVSVSVINCDTIFKSVTMFLYAEDQNLLP